MRSLPLDQHPALVVQVIRTTLESLQVHVSDIISDAEKKEHDLETKVATLRREIHELDAQAEARQEEIVRLEADLAETKTVRERLSVASRTGQSPAQGQLPHQAIEEIEVDQVPEPSVVVDGKS